MKLRALLVSLLLAVGSFLSVVPRPAHAVEQLYLNSYGSVSGLWARGHYRLHELEGKYRLEIEALSLQPNSNYPQSFRIAGFRLAYSYRGQATGESAAEPGRTGPRQDRPLLVGAGGRKSVKNLVVEVAKGRPPREHETLRLELQIMAAGGGYFTLVVGEFDGR